MKSKPTRPALYAEPFRFGSDRELYGRYRNATVAIRSDSSRYFIIAADE
jgi:hypothetical protein